MNRNEQESYSIEQAAKTLDVSVADIESYVKEGLMATDRDAAGAERLSRAQMRRLWSVVTLHRDLGINLPGVAAVLRLRQQFEHVRRDLALLVEIFERELGPDVWDRLWPEDRPRPAAHVAVEDISEPASSPASPEAPQTDTKNAPPDDTADDPPATGDVT